MGDGRGRPNHHLTAFLFDIESSAWFEVELSGKGLWHVKDECFALLSESDGGHDCGGLRPFFLGHKEQNRTWRQSSTPAQERTRMMRQALRAWASVPKEGAAYDYLT